MLPNLEILLCPTGALRKKTAFNQEEAQLLALVSHRHVVKMFAACTDGPNCFIVTEFLAGGSLHEVVFDFDIALGRLARGFSLRFVVFDFDIALGRLARGVLSPNHAPRYALLCGDLRRTLRAAWIPVGKMCLMHTASVGPRDPRKHQGGLQAAVDQPARQGDGVPAPRLPAQNHPPRP